jgi:hypothetical protein
MTGSILDMTAPVVTPPIEVQSPAAQTPATHLPVTGSFIGDGGTLHFAHAATHLPQELHSSITGFQARFEGKTVGDVFKSYSELEGSFTQLKGSRAVPEAATLESYGITRPEGVNDDYWNEASPKIQNFITKAHAAGIGKGEFSKLFEDYGQSLLDDQKRAEVQTQAAKQESYNELMNVWGAEFEPKRQTTFNHVKSVLQEIGAADSPHTAALMNNPVFIQMMHNQALKTAPGITQVPNGATPSPVSSAEQGLDIMHNPQNPYHEKFVAESRQGGGPTVDFVMKLRSSVRQVR